MSQHPHEPLPSGYYTLVLPRTVPAFTNHWNECPTDWTSQTRGNFPTEEIACQRAREILPHGAPFTVKYIPLGDDADLAQALKAIGGSVPLDETQAVVLEQEIERLRNYRDHHESRIHPDDEDRSMIKLYQKLIHTLIALRNCGCDLAATDGNHVRTCTKRGL